LDKHKQPVEFRISSAGFWLSFQTLTRHLQTRAWQRKPCRGPLRSRRFPMAGRACCVSARLMRLWGRAAANSEFQFKIALAGHPAVGECGGRGANGSRAVPLPISAAPRSRRSSMLCSGCAHRQIRLSSGDRSQLAMKRLATEVHPFRRRQVVCDLKASWSRAALAKPESMPGPRESQVSDNNNSSGSARRSLFTAGAPPQDRARVADSIASRSQQRSSSSGAPAASILTSSIECRLENSNLWEKFDNLGTEMIVTRLAGGFSPHSRCACPPGPRCQLHANADFAPCDDKRYRYSFHTSSWIVAGKSDPPRAGRVHVPTRTAPPGAPTRMKQIILNSMHRYQPRSSRGCTCRTNSCPLAGRFRSGDCSRQPANDLNGHSPDSIRNLRVPGDQVLWQ
uniref:T-box domain-containing protein n=1 Tax=Macrostomum lignano TaxID=282301 RepID=A0A1I8F6Z7_9PLAT